MQLSSSVNSLAKSLYSALHVDLSDIYYLNRDWDKYNDLSEADKKECIKNNTCPMIEKIRRPSEYDVEVFSMFAQTWGSTALGFGGIGGAAMTQAYTVIIYCRSLGEFTVYWNGDFAYKVLAKNEDGLKLFLEDVKNRNTLSIRDAKLKYKLN